LKHAIVAGLFAFLPFAAQAQQAIAIDGDTIALGPERIRIIGLDTPETFHARCDAERVLGYQAAGRLQRLLNTRRVQIERTGKSDRYRRSLARVFVGSEDVAVILIREGLARQNNGERRQGWC
jgi:endonuclease YncB( thermonuclease family)